MNFVGQSRFHSRPCSRCQTASCVEARRTERFTPYPYGLHPVPQQKHCSCDAAGRGAVHVALGSHQRSRKSRAEEPAAARGHAPHSDGKDVMLTQLRDCGSVGRCRSGNPILSDAKDLSRADPSSETAAALLSYRYPIYQTQTGRLHTTFSHREPELSQSVIDQSDRKSGLDQTRSHLLSRSHREG